jgi:hypothetical protein
MTSTRNKNTIQDYRIECKSYADTRQWIQYPYSTYGQAYDVSIPSLGITPSRMPWNTLSNNPVDIESSLLGINSTNLVYPQPEVIPELKHIPMKSYFETIPLILPETFVTSSIQRPFPIPK